jgi:flagellar biosynthesis protein FliQ
MTAVDAITLVHAAIWAVLVISAPCVVAAMAIGFVVSLLQALTQIQEATLAFVPKIIAVLLVAALTAPFMGRVVATFAAEIYERIANGY